MAARSTTERTVKTKFDGDSKDAIRAAKALERELKQLEREHARAQAAFVSQSARAADHVTSALSSTVKGVLAVGSAVSSAQGLAGATTAVTTFAGAALAVPGLLAAGAAAGGVFALAMSGIGDAIAAKDLEEFNEATKNMAPNAVAVAKAIRDQNSRFTDLKKTVQGNFFAGFDDDVRALADRYFPILKDRSGEIATEFNKMGREGAKALLDPRSVGAVNQVLTSTREGLQEMRPALGNVITGVLGLTGEGSKRFGALGKAITGVTQNFEDWVDEGLETGRINDLIDEGIDAAKTFGRTLGNVGEIGKLLWQGLSDGEQNFLEGLEETTQMVEDFLKSAEGREALKTLGTALKTTADVAREVFGTALKQAADIVVEAGPAFTEIARAIGDALVDALNIVGPILKDTAAFLSENKETVGDLVPLVLAVVGGYKALSIAKDATAWIGGLTTAFESNSKKAKDLDAAVGKGGKGSSGLAGSLAGLAAIVGAGVAIDIINDSDVAKANDFKITLDGILGAAEKLAKNGVLGLLTKYNDAVVNGIGDVIDKAQQGEIILSITSDTSQAERNLNDLKDQIRRSQEFVTINGNRRTADQALAEVLSAIDAGEGTVNVNGNTIDSQRALQDLISLINSSSGTVDVDGNPVPAGQVLFGLLRTVTGSRATMSIDADASAAQGVVNRFITMNNGRQVEIFVNARGDAGGLASAGRLASGGRPFDGRVRGPGTPTSDTAGLFRLSNEEHVLAAADVQALGGHAAVYRLRALARQGKFRGFADGGTPAFLNSTLPAPSRVPNVSVNTGSTTVTVLIDGQEFRGTMRTEIRRAKQEEQRRLRAGGGAL